MSLPNANIASWLDASAAGAPDRIAIAMDGPESRITFGELRTRVIETAAGLKREGLRPGGRVLLMIPMSIDLYTALLGTLAAGGVAVFVDPWVGARQIAALAAWAEPYALIGVPKSHLLRLLNADLRRIPLAVTTSRAFRLPWRKTLAGLRVKGAVPEWHEAAPGDTALITFTTGSSGTPKGAIRTHGILAAQHQALKEEFPYRDGDVDMPAFPVFALNNLASAITSIVPQMEFGKVAEVDPGVIRGQLVRHGVTTCTASPPFLDRLAVSIAARPEGRPVLRRILTGGAPVADDQLEAWKKAFPEAEIVVAYGSTEAEPVASISADEKLAAASALRPRSPGYCAGRPVRCTATRLLKLQRGPIAEATDVAPGEIGELAVAGGHVCREYDRNPEATAENKVRAADGTVWHRMGDTGYFDAEGRFWLVGRLHSTIRRGDDDVHPQLVEQAARRGDPTIRRAAAVGVPDKALGERVVVVLETSGTDPGAVRRRIREAGLVVDDIIPTAKPLPVDPRHNSKIDYAALRKALEGGRL